MKRHSANATATAPVGAAPEPLTFSYKTHHDKEVSLVITRNVAKTTPAYAFKLEGKNTEPLRGCEQKELAALWLPALSLHIIGKLEDSETQKDSADAFVKAFGDFCPDAKVEAVTDAPKSAEIGRGLAGILLIGALSNALKGGLGGGLAPSRRDGADLSSLFGPEVEDGPEDPALAEALRKIGELGKGKRDLN